MNNFNKNLFEIKNEEKTEDYINRLKNTCYLQSYRINRLSEFFAYVSHELRTPLNSIICFSQQLLHLAKSNKEIEFINIIQNSSKNLLLIATDLLDFSKIESGKLKLSKKQFEIKKEIVEVMCLVNMSAYSKGLNLNLFFEKTTPEKIEGDPLRIKQILCNLVTNAIKYTNQGEINCFIKFYYKNNNNAELEISVQDTGIGIKEDLHKRLFKNYNQLNNNKNNILDAVEFSSGLGLAIVKKLVTAMNGKFGFKSKVNYGSTFWFKIPVKIINGHVDTPILLNNFSNKKIYFIDLPINAFNSIKLELEHEPVEIISINSEEFFNKNLHIVNENGIAVFFLSSTDKITISKTINRLKLCKVQYINTRCIILLPFGVPYTILDEIDELGDIDKVILPFQHKNFCNILLNKKLIQIKKDVVSKISKSNKTNKSKKNNLKILVVDDQVFNLRVMETFIQRTGHTCISINNSHDAIEYLKTNLVDLLFLDIQLTDLSGIEVLKIINNFPFVNKPKIFALTAGVSSEQLMRLEKLNFEKIIKKPLSFKSFKTLLSKYNKKSQLLPSLPKIKKIPKKNIDILSKNSNLLEEFKCNYYDIINAIKTSIRGILLKDNNEKDFLNEIILNLHNLKGLIGFLGIQSLIDWVEQVEEIIEKRSGINLEDILLELNDFMLDLSNLNL